MVGKGLKKQLDHEHEDDVGDINDDLSRVADAILKCNLRVDQVILSPRNKHDFSPFQFIFIPF